MEQETTVLIVYENKAIRERLAKKLQTLPSIEVVADAGDLETAIELAWFWEPEIIIADAKWSDALQKVARASPHSRLVWTSLGAVRMNEAGRRSTSNFS